MQLSRCGPALLCSAIALLASWAANSFADEPLASYIFPAGARRGATVEVHVGGHHLHEACDLLLHSEGIRGPRRLVRGAENRWFEGPRIPLPASQRKEDYPWPQVGAFRVQQDARLGLHYWQVRTAQGIASPLPFVVGDLPEIMEQEIDGRPLPTQVTAPVTINGRIFPREDVDLWTFSAEQGRTYVCEVAAARLQSPLDSRLVVTGPDGNGIAENVDAPGLGNDSRVMFTARRSGLHQVAIHDANYGGLQHYVYRLTITDGPHLTSVYPLGGSANQVATFRLLGANLPPNAVKKMHLPAAAAAELQLEGANSLPVRVEVSDLPELLEPWEGSPRPVIRESAVANGRIAAAGEQDAWQIHARKGETWAFDVRAAAWASHLDSTLRVQNESGDVLAENDDAGPSGDSALTWSAPADGAFQLVVADAFQRGGRDFAYRLHCRRVTTDDSQLEKRFPFRLEAASDTILAPVGGKASLEVKVVNRGKFKEPLRVLAAGLPPGVRAKPLTLKPNQKKGRVEFSADNNVLLQVASVQLWGVVRPNVEPTFLEQAASATHGPLPPLEAQPEVRRLVHSATVVPDRDGQFTLATVLQTPFKFTGEFETKYAACGSEFTRSFQLVRDGYTGPVEVRLAERQVRHLQGVTGQPVVVDPNEVRFDFTIRLAPWMEVGRTSRTCLMATGKVVGPAGRKHTVSYTSHAQNDQIIVLVDPASLAVSPLKHSVRAVPGATLRAPVRVSRGNGVTGPVRVELRTPAHMSSIQATPIEIPAGKELGMLKIRCGSPLEPVNMPATIRATTLQGPRLVAEAKLEL